MKTFYPTKLKPLEPIVQKYDVHEKQAKKNYNASFSLLTINQSQLTTQPFII